MSFGKAILALTVAVAASLACAFDISFALSGCVSSSFQQVVGAASPWFSVVGECASGQNLDKLDKNVTYETYKAPCLVARGVGDWSGTAFVFCPRIVGGSDKLYAGTFSESSYNYIGEMATQFVQPVVSGDSSKSAFWLGTNAEMSNVVFTISGHPYSRVRNLTSSSQTLNGVTIPSGDERWLYLPVRLHKWPENWTDAKKYYLTDVNGNAIDYKMYTENANYRGCCVYWSGNFDIREHGWPYAQGQDVAGWADESLVRSDDAPVVLRGTDGSLLRSKLRISSTNLLLATQWDFSRDAWGDSPKAYVDGELWCSSHSASHIGSYPVAAEDFEFDDLTGDGDVELSLALAPDEGFSGGSCTMRVWDNDFGTSPDGYEAAPPIYRAEVAAGTGTAKFRVTVNIYKGTWKVEPL